MKSKGLSLKWLIIVLMVWSANLVLAKRSMEPYPTFLMPGTGSALKIDREENTHFILARLCALDTANQWQEINFDQMAYKLPLPEYYMQRVGFGVFRGKPIVESVEQKLGLHPEKDKPAKFAAFLAWFKQGLEAQHLQADSVKLISYRYTVSLKSKQLVDKKIVNEKTGYLF